MGRPEPRIDGRLKVTGAARYPSDLRFDDEVYAFLVTSAISKGRIARIDLDRARAVPGVLEILTHENADKIRPARFFAQGGTASTTIVPLGSPKIWHDGQIVALVLAETYEAAREARYKLDLDYEAEPAAATFGCPGTETVTVQEPSEDRQTAVGDAEAELAASAVRIDVEYGTPTQHHNAIELFATTCVWSGDELTVYEASQFVYGARNSVAEQLGMDPDKVRVISTFVGGAFGSKGALTPRTALVALAARRLGRPVKLVATRDQGFTIASYRAETRHRVRLGASRDGKLAGYSHEGWEVTSRPDTYFVGGTDSTSRMYAFGSVAARIHVVRADRNTPGYMRSPPEVPYMYALECAMDELAVELGMDPVELRRLNDTQSDPITGKPYSSRSLMQCYDAAAAAFGWSRRSADPGSMRDGEWLIGWGCATATYPTYLASATASVRLSPDGRVRVATAAHDLGTGAYTVIAQTAAERLGVPLEAVEVLLGDTDLPAAPIAGGSNTTASVCSAVLEACDAVRRRPPGGVIEEHAEWRPPGLRPEAVDKLRKGRSLMTGGTSGDRLRFAFGAEFVEVRVHERTREIRVPRVVGAFAAGRIINPRTARSQLMGGLIWGVSSALYEETEIDVRAARYVNTNIAEYLVPVNADVDQVEVILVPEQDDALNPSGAKGIGELGNVGTAAAVANAVYHATGKRIRQLPIRIDDLL